VLAALRSTQQNFNKRMHAFIINLSSEALQFIVHIHVQQAAALPSVMSRSAEQPVSA
jgi:hypothetical protein